MGEPWAFAPAGWAGGGVGSGVWPDYTLKRGEQYDPEFVWDSYAVGSFEGYYRLQSGIELPCLMQNHAFFSATGTRFDYPRLAYYGEGPDSRKGGRTDYRMQDDQFRIRGGYRLWWGMRVGAEESFQRIDIRAGIARCVLC